MGKVGVFGLGPIGLGIAKALHEREDVDIVAAIDSNERLIGRDIGELFGQAAIGTTVVATPREALEQEAPGVVVQATSSRLADVVPQIEAVASHGWSVISTCEELAYPRAVDPSLADDLERIAADAGVTVVGAGVNPGFVMDLLPLVLTGACLRVDHVFIRRIVDTNQRRPQLQTKVGVTMSLEEFERQASSGALGHVGLRQSAFLIADRLGWTNFEYEETLTPVRAAAHTETPIGSVYAGAVLGQRQLATLRSNGHARVEMQLEMYAGAAAEDRIEIRGEPSITQVLEGGLNGDLATIALITNLVDVVAAARPGLSTMADLLPLACSTATRGEPAIERALEHSTHET